MSDLYGKFKENVMALYESIAKKTQQLIDFILENKNSMLNGLKKARVEVLNVDNVVEGTSNIGRFAKRQTMQGDVIGKLDSTFVELSQTKRIEAAFKEIQNTFGTEYANRIRNLYNKVNHQSLSAVNLDDMGEFNFSQNGSPL